MKLCPHPPLQGQACTAYLLCMGMSRGRAPGSTGDCISAWNVLNCCRSTSGGCKRFPNTTGVTVLPAPGLGYHISAAESTAPTPELGTCTHPRGQRTTVPRSGCPGGASGHGGGWLCQYSGAGSPTTQRNTMSPRDQPLGYVLQVY